MGAWPKWCACGRGYKEQAWDCLPFVGYQDTGGPATVGEQRNCACGSTIQVDMPTHVAMRKVRIDLERSLKSAEKFLVRKGESE